MTKLTPKQQAFADLYIETANATTSYKNSGYSVKSDKEAAVEGSKLLRNPKVRAYIEERMDQKSAQRVAKQDQILSFLTQVMRGELTEQVPTGVGEGMQELEDKNPSLKYRVKAAELLGKRYSMWTEKKEIEGNMGVTIVDNVGDDFEHD
ncbi:terminase [Bacillus endophyticus]|uniref:terminase small subunit n=1 Tax=Priestia endophytica TaxID=135735 RepID=UPI0018CFC001|nr:terminase small subunit [Priestia endophytica]MBG9813917.1 terminase [Priestia endophytica]